MQKFVYRHKSISIGTIDNANTSLIMSQYSALGMSSGGAIINEEGKIVGIHFGNYYDIESIEII